MDTDPKRDFRNAAKLWRESVFTRRIKAPPLNLCLICVSLWLRTWMQNPGIAFAIASLACDTANSGFNCGRLAAPSSPTSPHV